MDRIDFIVPAGHREVVITGEVLEKPAKSPAFETGMSKFMGSFIDGRPYPLGPQSSAYNLRVMEAPASDLSRQTNVLILGEIYDGRISAGDFVQVVAKENVRLFSLLPGPRPASGIEYTAVSITNSTAVVLNRQGDFVESTIRPTFSISAGAIRALLFLMLTAVILLVAWLANGGVTYLLELLVGIALVVLDLIGPILMLLVAIYFLYKAVVS